MAINELSVDITVDAAIDLLRRRQQRAQDRLSEPLVLFDKVSRVMGSSVLSLSGAMAVNPGTPLALGKTKETPSVKSLGSPMTKRKNNEKALRLARGPSLARIHSAPTLREDPACIKHSAIVSLPAVRSNGSNTPAAEASSPSAEQVDDTSADLRHGRAARRPASAARRTGSKNKSKQEISFSYGRQEHEDEHIEQKIQKATEKLQKEPEFSEAKMARDLCLPFDVMQDGVNVFKKHVHFEEGTNLMKYELAMQDFAKVLLDITESASLDALPKEFVEKAFKGADRDGSGSIDVYEFVIWHASIAFNQEVSMNETDRNMRRIARELGCQLVDLDRYMKAFETFDTDGSGAIELEEFTGILNLLLKVPNGHKLPDDRVLTMWRQADKQSAGSLDFEQFCHFYRSHFDEDAECLLADFYHALRRV